MIYGLNVITCRPDLMWLLLDSLWHLPAHWRVYALCQDYSSADLQRVQQHPRTAGILVRPRTAPFIGRMLLLDAFPEVDVWADCDDDMVMLETVDYEAMVEFAVAQPGCGIVQGDFANTYARLAKSFAERNAPTFERSPVVSTGGGAVYTRTVRDVLVTYARKPYSWDDIVKSSLLYADGYENWRYYGSWVLHTPGRPKGWRQFNAESGGAAGWVPGPASVCRQYPYNEKAGKVLWPATRFASEQWKLVTPEARERHAAIRKERGWL